LYGYDKAKQSIRKADYSILVEGQMDLLMAHQAGFTNTVASSGTALTISHLGLLKRISNKIIMSFDSDNAGAKAAERGWALALSAGMEVKIAAIPKGFDPADLILKDKELFKDVLKTSQHLIEFLLNRVSAEVTDKQKLWSHIKKEILPYIYLLDSNTEKSRYVSKISELINIKEDFIWDDLKKVKLDEELQPKNEEVISVIERDPGIDMLKKGSLERNLAGIIVGLEGKGPIMNPETLKKKVKDIIGAERYTTFENELQKLSGELAFENEGYYGNFDDEKLKKEIDYSLLNLREETYKRELNSLLLELKKAENTKEIEKINSISIRLKEIMGKMAEIKQEKNNLL
jgi:DNA primase